MGKRHLGGHLDARRPSSRRRSSPRSAATSRRKGSDLDLDEAKALLEDAGFPNGEGLPPITYYEPAEDTADEKSRWKAFLDGIQEAIGMEITHNTDNDLEQIQDLQADNGGRQFDIVWWWNVTETPTSVERGVPVELALHARRLQLVRRIWNQSGDFDPGADSKTFDELVDKADVEQDADTRNDLYRQAEELVLKNAVYIPLGNWVQMYVQKPYVQGTKQGPWTGRIPIWFDKDVVVLSTIRRRPEAEA